MMDKTERTALFKAMSATVREFVGTAIEGISKRIDSLDARIVGISMLPGPKGENGKDADPEVVRSFVTNEVSKAVAAIPVPKDGKDGDPGKDAPALDTAVIIAEVIKQIPVPQIPTASIVEEIDFKVAKAVSALPVPKDGKDGESIVGPPGKDGESIIGPEGKPGPPGKDASPEEIREEVSRALAEWPKPKDGTPGKDGRDGKDVSLDEIQGVVLSEVQRAVSALPRAKDGAPGKDAEPINPDTIFRMVVDEVAKAVSAMPKPKDGIDGRDGIAKDGRDGAPGRDALQIEILPAIDPLKSYPRGTFACYAGGTLWAFRNTVPVDKDLASAGWQVIFNGIASEEPIESDNPRESGYERTFTDGRKRIVREYRDVPLFRGIWESGAEYAKADIVQRDGSMWFCRVSGTKVGPGNNPDWTLCTKHGRDGKDGKNGERGLPGPEGRPGRDLTQMAFDGSKH